VLCKYVCYLHSFVGVMFESELLISSSMLGKYSQISGYISIGVWNVSITWAGHLFVYVHTCVQAACLIEGVSIVP
jgi:hypothetical protein